MRMSQIFKGSLERKSSKASHRATTADDPRPVLQKSGRNYVEA